MTRAAILKDLEGQSTLTPDDVLRVRAVLFADMLVSPEEVDSLFRINDGAETACREWHDLFVEAMTDYLVRQESPAGYVDEAKASWLMQRISHDGWLKGPTELELLIRVLEKADQAPQSLSRFAVRQIANAALEPERQAGDGPTLTAEEVSQLRRALYAFAGDGGGAAISREEAELLFEINDAARGRPNDPSWRHLFAQAIGASIMLAAGYRAPPREEALRRQTWLDTPTKASARVMVDSLRSVFSGGMIAGLKTLREREDQMLIDDLAADEAAGRQAAPVDLAEAQWLMSRIGRDGTLDDNERALLLFVKEEASAIAPELADLISQAETARPGETFGRRAS